MRHLVVAALMAAGTGCGGSAPPPGAPTFELVVDHPRGDLSLRCPDGCTWFRTTHGCGQDTCTSMVSSAGVRGYQRSEVSRGARIVRPDAADLATFDLDVDATGPVKLQCLSGCTWSTHAACEPGAPCRLRVSAKTVALR